MTTEHTHGLLSMVGQVEGWNCYHDGIGSSCNSGIRIADTGEVIALAVAHTTDLSANPDCRPNARRLVACWNALIDLPQAALDGGWTRAGLESYGIKMEQQRDELLELVASFAQLFDEWEQIIPQDARAEFHPVYEQARAAIAEAGVPT